MTGLEKIITRVQQDADRQRKEVLERAQREAEEILQKAQQNANAKQAEILARAEAQCGQALQMAQAKQQQQKKQALLAERVQLIQETIEAAVQAMHALAADEYFTALKQLAVRNAMPGQGVMHLNASDLARKPADFIDNVNAALPAGASIALAQGAADLADGFLLVYGDIEVNCTFRALVDADLDAIKDLAYTTLFAADRKE